MTAWTTNPIDMPDTSLTGYGMRDYSRYRDQGVLNTELPQGVFITRMRGSFAAVASADTAGLVQLRLGVSSYFFVGLGSISAGESHNYDFDILVQDHYENPAYGPLEEWSTVFSIEAQPDLGIGARIDLSLSNISVLYDLSDVPPGPEPEKCFWTDMKHTTQACGE